MEKGLDLPLRAKVTHCKCLVIGRDGVGKRTWEMMARNKEMVTSNMQPP